MSYWVGMLSPHDTRPGSEGWKGNAGSAGPVFIKHLKSNVYVTLNTIGSFLCNLCFHWLIQIFIN